MQSDEVVLVDEQDQVIGKLDKFEAHRHPAKLHRAVSVWMIDEDDQLLFQQRSPKKITGGEQWGNTVCGNVWPEESYEECARRRLRVELGIEGVALEPIEKFRYQAYANEKYAENEIDQMFLSRVQNNEVKIQLNPDETMDFLWVDKKEFFSEIDRFLGKYEIEKGRAFPSVEETQSMTTDQLQQWTLPTDIQVNQRELTIVPWTVLMAGIQSLRSVLGI